MAHSWTRCTQDRDHPRCQGHAEQAREAQVLQAMQDWVPWSNSSRGRVTHQLWSNLSGESCPGGWRLQAHSAEATPQSHQTGGFGCEKRWPGSQPFGGTAARRCRDTVKPAFAPNSGAGFLEDTQSRHTLGVDQQTASRPPTYERLPTNGHPIWNIEFVLLKWVMVIVGE